VNWIDALSAVAGVVLALSGLVVSIVALRLTREQARSYLFPVPAVIVAQASTPDRSINIKNFGAGAMLSVWIELKFWSPGRQPQIANIDLPALGAGEEAPLLDPSFLNGMALSRVEATISYRNIKGVRQKEKSELSAVDLGGLDS
jgi:hypothetical protein